MRINAICRYNPRNQQKGDPLEFSLPAKFRKLIEDRVRTGKYATAEDVVKAALTTLDQNDRFGEVAPGELDQPLGGGGAHSSARGADPRRVGVQGNSAARRPSAEPLAVRA